MAETEPFENASGLPQRWIFPQAINDGVYRCGFASTQEAYDSAHAAHAEGMRDINDRLGRSRFLCGDRFTLADVRLFTTLVRYDAIYSIHFKTGFRLKTDYPNLHRFARDVLSGANAALDARRGCIIGDPPRRGHRGR